MRITVTASRGRPPNPAMSHARVRTATRDRVGTPFASDVRPWLLSQAGGPRTLPRGTDWRNPLSRVFCQCHAQTHPAVASSVSWTDRAGSPAGPGPRSPQTAGHLEPGTNLSPVTGSILLRVSRSMTESNGTFRKNTLRGENSTTVSWRGPRAGLWALETRASIFPARGWSLRSDLSGAPGTKLSKVTRERCRQRPPCHGSLG